MQKMLFNAKICIIFADRLIQWRDARVVDRAALEMRCTGNCT